MNTPMVIADLAQETWNAILSILYAAPIVGLYIIIILAFMFLWSFVKKMLTPKSGYNSLKTVTFGDESTVVSNTAASIISIVLIFVFWGAFTGSSLLPGFMHAPGAFTGDGEFEYTIRDADGNEDTAKVSVIVFEAGTTAETPVAVEDGSLAQYDAPAIQAYRSKLLIWDKNEGGTRAAGAEVLAKDMLFATLDPTLRRLELPEGTLVILSDTVGFVSDLPTHLVAAFRATLEEVIEADLILHVRDISHQDTEAQAEDVKKTLDDLGVNPQTGAPVVEVWNKIDCLDPAYREKLLEEKADEGPIALSALTGEGIDQLYSRIDAFIAQNDDIFTVRLPVTDGALIAQLYQVAEVLDREDTEEYIEAEVRVTDKQRGPFRQTFAPYLEH